MQKATTNVITTLWMQECVSTTKTLLLSGIRAWIKQGRGKRKERKRDWNDRYQEAEGKKGSPTKAKPIWGTLVTAQFKTKLEEGTPNFHKPHNVTHSQKEIKRKEKIIQTFQGWWNEEVYSHLMNICFFLKLVFFSILKSHKKRLINQNN